METLILKDEQYKLYSKSWDEYSWSNEKLFPILLELNKILSGSTANGYIPFPIRKFNVIGCPRNGTKWLQEIIYKLVNSPTNGLMNLLHKEPKEEPIGHFHVGLWEDFKGSDKNFFIYRDIRDAIISGYFYLKSGLHKGTMGCTPEVYNSISKENAIEKQLIMYMKYRMPVYYYWFRLSKPDLMKIKYESLLTDTEVWLVNISRFLKKNIGKGQIREVLDSISFQTMSGGRDHGNENRNSHQRKGIYGDWKNHFTDRHIVIFEKMGGREFLNATGYDW